MASINFVHFWHIINCLQAKSSLKQAGRILSIEPPFQETKKSLHERSSDFVHENFEQASLKHSKNVVKIAGSLLSGIFRQIEVE